MTTGTGSMRSSDNCPSISNPVSARQRRGRPSAMPANERPVLRVSSDPAHLTPTSTSIQNAVDAPLPREAYGSRSAPVSGRTTSRCWSIAISRSHSSASSVRKSAPGPVIIDGDDGPAFDVSSSHGPLPVRFENLTLRGNQGIRASTDVDISDATFELVTWEALDLSTPARNTLSRGEIRDTVSIGADVAEGVQLDVSRDHDDWPDQCRPDRCRAPQTVENTVISGGNGARRHPDGPRPAPSTSATARSPTTPASGSTTSTTAP